MGFDQREQAGSSGAAVAIVVAVLIVAVLGIVVVGGAALFWVRTARLESMIAQERAVAELRRVGEEAHRADTEAQRNVEEARVETTPYPRLNFEVKLDREGNARLAGEKIRLDDLKAKLAKLKEETNNALSVQISADSECPAKHVVSVADICKQIGVVDLNIASSGDSSGELQ